MQLYRVEWQDHLDAFHQSFEGTRGDAHATAKSAERRETARIELHDVPVDKDNVLAILRDEDIKSEVLQTWSLTTRGGLQECANGE